MAAAVAMLAAVSCNKEINNIDPVTPGTDAVVYTAYVDGAETKTSLGATEGEGEWINTTTRTQWDANDQITIHNGIQGYTFTTTDSGSSAKFTTTEERFAATEVMAVYPASNTTTADVVNKKVTAMIPTYQPSRDNNFSEGAVPSVAYTKDQSLAFKNAATLLKFTVKGTNVKGLVFYGNNNEAVSGNILVSLNENNTIKSIEAQQTTITENDVTETKYITWAKVWAKTNDWCFDEEVDYYLAVVPQKFEKGFAVQLEVDGVGLVEVKKLETSYELKPNTIVDLGELEYTEPVVSDDIWGVCGTFTNNWDITNNVHMTATAGGWYILENVKIYKDDEFKFVTNDFWSNSLGAIESFVAENETEYELADNSQINLKVNTNGLFTLSLNPSEKKFKVECTEEYTDLQVNITINNNAKWNPLYIHLQHNEEVIANNVLVSGNAFTVDGKYIGESLSYYFTSDSKKSEQANVRITRDGATVTLEEKVIKFTFKLETANAKQWWGDKACMYIWESGTSADNTWPGVEMTSDGDYTWHVNLPYELAGKKIKYIINNGKSWQSADQTITIAAEGHTVYETKIGIK